MLDQRHGKRRGPIETRKKSQVLRVGFGNGHIKFIAEMLIALLIFLGLEGEASVFSNNFLF